MLGFLDTQRNVNIVGYSRSGDHHPVAESVGVDPAGIRSLPSGDLVIAMPQTGVLKLVTYETGVTSTIVGGVYAQAAEAQIRHLRTKGNERGIDLIVVRDDQRVVALEVKLSATVSDKDVRHLRWLADQLGADLLDAVIITTGTDAYRRADGIAVVPAALLGP